MIKRYGKPINMGKIRSLQNEINNSEKTKKACTRYYRSSVVNETDSICRLCGSNETHLFFKAYGKYLYYECDICGALYLHNLPDMSSMYLGDGENACGFDYYGQEEKYEERIDQIVAPKVDFVLDICNKTNIGVKRWLDIGAGCGHLLSYIERIGIEGFGYESDKNQFDYMFSRGLNVKNAFLDDQSLRWGGVKNDVIYADVVSLITVLEHMEKPVEFIKKLGEMMKKDSVLVIEVPKHPSLAAFANITHRDVLYRHITPPVHLQIFSEKSMSMILGSEFEIIGNWMFGQGFADMMNYSLIQSHMDPMDIYDLIMESNNNIQQTIDECGLADEMLVVARRR